MNVKRYTSLYNNDYKAWASNLENQIINHNSNIEALQDLAGQFIEAVNQYKDNPRESNYYVLIKTYKPLIDDMTQKKYNDSLFKQVKEAYHQITNFNTVWARDFDAYQALIEASKSSKAFKIKR